MSLINQMLKDLEARRAPAAGMEAVLDGVNIRADHTSRRGHVAWLLVIALAGVSMYLFWDRWQSEMTSAHPASAMLPAFSAPDTAPPTAGIAAAEAIETPSAPQASVTAPLETTRPDAPAPEVAAVAPVEESVTAVADSPLVTPPAPVPAVTSQPVVTTESRVEKTPRPLNAAQRAALVYETAARDLRHGLSDRAETGLREALAIDPEHRDARMALAALYVNADRRAEAEDLLIDGLTRAPAFAAFAQLYGRMLMERGADQDAIAVLERARPAINADPDYHALLAALYQRRGDHAQAARVYRDLVQVRPGAAVWWMGFGMSLEGLADRDGALNAFRRARAGNGLTQDLLRFVDQRIARLERGG
jgi:MSHA biogenesis protein MshN